VTGSGPNDQGPLPEDQTEPATGPEPATPAWDLPSDSANPRAEALAGWVADQRGAHTMAALERSALESGYTKAEFDEAVRLAGKVERERQVIKPLRSQARLIVLLGYAIVWVFFAIQYLVIPAPGSYVGGSGLQTILTISLLVTIGISLLWIHGVKPDPDRAGRALAIFLAVPLVLLIGVAGLCLPFLPVR
jgi:hypothetical protein